MKNRVVVYKTNQEHMANLIQTKLEAAGINTLILNKKDTPYKTFGYIELHVLEADAERAKKIIAQSNE